MSVYTGRPMRVINAAVHRSAQGPYWGLAHSRVISPPAAVLGIPPVVITIHELVVTVPGEPHPHLQAKHDDIVATGTELGLVLVVIVVGLWQVVVRVVPVRRS